MSLAHSTIKDLLIDRPHPETDPEIIEILRGCEQHVNVKRLYALVWTMVGTKEIKQTAGEIVGAGVVTGFLLGHAFAEANSLERLVGEPKFGDGRTITYDSAG